MRLSFRTWMSILTLTLIGVIVFLSRHELNQAWDLMSRVNLWVLALVIPIAMISNLASGEMIFSYLRQKKLINHVNPFVLMRISFELNFVNHVLPSGGVSGISYVNWRLGKFGVSTGKATMAQGVKYVVGFAALATLLALAVLLVTVDGNINRWTILMSSTLVFLMVMTTMIGIYLIRSPKRMHLFAKFFSRRVNALVRKVTLGRKKRILSPKKVEEFLDDIHDDYLDLVRDKRALQRPYLWGLLFTVMEIALFYIVFLALGSPINPAPILIAYGVASMAGFIVVTPGGAGAYEAIMVIILTMAGLNQSQSIAGIVLARVIILLLTILLGYLFYQQALIKYGKRAADL